MSAMLLSVTPLLKYKGFSVVLSQNILSLTILNIIVLFCKLRMVWLRKKTEIPYISGCREYLFSFLHLFVSLLSLFLYCLGPRFWCLIPLRIGKCTTEPYRHNTYMQILVLLYLNSLKVRRHALVVLQWWWVKEFFNTTCCFMLCHIISNLYSTKFWQPIEQDQPY